MLVICVPQLRKDLEELKRLIEVEVTPRQKMRVMIQAVAYLMLDSRGLGFGLVVWSQSRLLLEAREFTLLYQVRFLNFIEEENLTEQI